MRTMSLNAFAQHFWWAKPMLPTSAIPGGNLLAHSFLATMTPVFRRYQSSSFDSLLCNRSMSSKIPHHARPRCCNKCGDAAVVSILRPAGGKGCLSILTIAAFFCVSAFSTGKITSGIPSLRTSFTSFPNVFHPDTVNRVFMACLPASAKCFWSPLPNRLRSKTLSIRVFAPTHEIHNWCKFLGLEFYAQSSRVESTPTRTRNSQDKNGITAIGRNTIRAGNNE